MSLISALLLAFQAAAPCTGAEPVPPALAAFGTGNRIAASPRAGERFPLVRIGQPTTVAFARASQVRFVRTPARAAQSGDHGGMVAFDVTRAGTYRVAFGGRGWVDVLERGRALPSITHGHGPKCSAIRKIVTFRLQPGRHVLQVSNLDAASAGLMIVAD